VIRRKKAKDGPPAQIKISDEGVNMNRLKTILIFLMHQLISTIGVMVVAGSLTSVVISVLRLFGWTPPEHYLSKVLTGSQYFPVQITVAFTLGWVVRHRFRHQVMLWVWVIPAAFLIYLMIALPTTAAALASDSRFMHFFGRGCQIESHCFDQVGATLPFYASVAYSIAALIEGKRHRATFENSDNQVQQPARHA
jgi:hypothetical protein